MARFTGLVDWFNVRKGYGFVNGHIVSEGELMAQISKRK